MRVTSADYFCADEVVFRGVAIDEPVVEGGAIYNIHEKAFFRVEDLEKALTKLSKSSYFLYAYDDKGHRCEVNAQSRLMLNVKGCYYIVNGFENSFKDAYIEIISNCDATVAELSHDIFFALLPFDLPQNTFLPLNNKNRYDWEEMYGINSFEELCDFYEKSYMTQYTIDKAERTITLNVKKRLEGMERGMVYWYPITIKLIADDDGIRVDGEDLYLYSILHN